MKRLIFILLFLCGCSIVKITNYDTQGNVTSTEKHYKLWQLQVVKDSASIDNYKIYGSKAKIPLIFGESLGYVEFVLGYLSTTQSIIPRKDDGELPSVIVDLTSDKESMSDTYATGKISEQVYPNNSKGE